MKASPPRQDHFASPPPPPRDDLAVVTRSLAQLEAAVTAACARMPWLDEESALEHVLEPALEDVTAGLTKAQVHTIAGVLQRLAGQFGHAASPAGETYTS